MKILLSMMLMIALAVCSVAVPQPQSTSPSSESPTSAEAAPTQPSWAGLGLPGSLILILHSPSGVDIARLSLGDGSISPIYHASDQAYLGAALVSPDRQKILVMYAPPATASSQVSYARLYLLPIDGQADLSPLIASPKAEEAFFAPAWALDGQSIYTSHYTRGSGDGSTPDQFDIDRVSLDGKVRLVLKNAQWPSLSPDGTQLAYVTAFATNGQNDLYLAEADGANPKPAIPPGSFLAVDDHFFTPDGKSLIFSAVNPQPTPVPTFWEKLFGIQVISAHSIPSDWYQVDLGGNQITRLTNLNDTGMYATLSPDKKWVAFISQTGIYVMRPDGSQLTQLNQLVATGTVDWVP